VQEGIEVIMFRTISDGPPAWESLLPAEVLRLPEELARVDALPDDPVFFAHNTRELRCRRGLDNFPEIITRLADMAERFATILDCADVSFLADGTLDELPLPSRLGVTRVGGIDLTKPRIRAALAAALDLAAAPHGFTVAEHAAKVSAMTGQSGYTIRQAAYDLRKLPAVRAVGRFGTRGSQR
jgi:hypothetical protein